MLKKIILILTFTISCTSCTTNENENEKPLSTAEKNIINIINHNNDHAFKLLEQLVNINSSTENIAGVHQVGAIVQKEFEKLGFTSEWKYPPKTMPRAGTLLLTRKGTQGKHILLIGHLDTVFPKASKFQHYSQKGNIAKGPGVIDDKGGVVLMLYALKALEAEGALNNTSITIALTGDEEYAGTPISVARQPLLQAAKDVDIALDFEPSAGIKTATTSRRGTSNWEIVSTGKPAHSSALFQTSTGYGAIFELSRVLNAAQEKLAQEKYITFNPGVIIGGTEAAIEKNTGSIQGYGKDNIVAKIARAKGDMRFLTAEQQELIKNTLIDITKNPLMGTTSKIIFEERIPAMPPTDNNQQLLEMYSDVSKVLGYGAVKPIPPEYRGAADISHVAALIPANLSGLGPTGGGTHTVYETMDIASFKINTERAAILMYRLTR